MYWRALPATSMVCLASVCAGGVLPQPSLGTAAPEPPAVPALPAAPTLPPAPPLATAPPVPARPAVLVVPPAPLAPPPPVAMLPPVAVLPPVPLALPVPLAPAVPLAPPPDRPPVPGSPPVPEPDGSWPAQEKISSDSGTTTTGDDSRGCMGSGRSRTSPEKWATKVARLKPGADGERQEQVGTGRRCHYCSQKANGGIRLGQLCMDTER